MKITISLKAVALVAATLAWVHSGQAGDATRCDKVYEQVRSAVEREPQKVLVIVEDAMVANELCACEIVKGAIAGSHANRDLVRQIVLTATHVAPKMAPLIAECAGAAQGGGKEVVASAKQSVGVQPEGVQPPVAEGGADYRTTPGDIRGVYLIQPSTGGFSTTPPPTNTKTGSKIVVKCTPCKHSVPQSPSVAQGP